MRLNDCAYSEREVPFEVERRDVISTMLHDALEEAEHLNDHYASKRANTYRGPFDSEPYLEECERGSELVEDIARLIAKHFGAVTKESIHG